MSTEYIVGGNGFLRKGNSCKNCQFAKRSEGLFVRKYELSPGCEIEDLYKVFVRFAPWHNWVLSLEEAMQNGQVKRLLGAREGSRPPIGWPRLVRGGERLTVIEALQYLAKEKGTRLCGVIFDSGGVKVKSRKMEN